jgi:hypothetical protein
MDPAQGILRTGGALQKLYLVGYTSDLENLIFSRQRGVKSGGFMVPVDDRLRRTLTEIARLEQESTPSGGEPPEAEAVPEAMADAEDEVAAAAAEPGQEGVVQAPDRPRRRPAYTEPEAGQPTGRSRLTPKEIQQELRRGRSVLEVAKMAGTEITWVERFVGPILAEREGIVEIVRAAMISRPRLGRSAMTVGEAIAANLRDRKGPVSTGAKGEGWTVLRRDGLWEVTFRYSVKGQPREAVFCYELDTRTVKALNATAAQLGWRSFEEGEAPGEVEPVPEPSPPARGALPARPAGLAARPGAGASTRPAASARPAAGGLSEEERRPARPSLWGSAVATGARDARDGQQPPQDRPGARARSTTATGPPARGTDPRGAAATGRPALGTGSRGTAATGRPSRGTDVPEARGTGSPPGAAIRPGGTARLGSQAGRLGGGNDRGDGARRPGYPGGGTPGGGRGPASNPRDDRTGRPVGGERPQWPERPERSSLQGAGPADDRPSFARNSSSPRPRRLLSGSDEDDFKEAVARTRAKRTAGRLPPPPPPAADRQRPPAKKRLPDDWLLEP